MPDEYFDDLRINNKDTILTTPKYKHALPTLGMAGWVTDLAPATDFLFSYYFTTLHSTTYTSQSDIKSIQYTISQYFQDPVKLREYIESDIMFLLEKYFYVNDVNVKVNNLNNNNDSAYEIRIKAVIVKENIGYTVGYLVRTVNSKLLTFAKLNNGDDING